MTCRMLCPIEADMTQSFSGNHCADSAGQPAPAGHHDAGRCRLFQRARSSTAASPIAARHDSAARFIAHYIVGEAEKVNEFYHPVLNFNGEEVDLLGNEDGGPCGVFAVDGEPAIEMIRQ